mmetsp:Transcript_8185/g.20453  ORF Transcript_8185/g.20453 Transcript_8185/m.20453 type:complete len:141 (-) Transcript_8185:385-807(-)|eukprot:CAMPEP_0202857252 /NCGR_PEP_ID=MMETSP1391-20130828/270_1 /ASSEMBLY_ACC=CAM_ASM_000867 /TAXON_ID=1034604 /ORGANISM="Chlamydomonas leiostraca, Strain SAG 11-49" /LENGTH=140 /DNA_ID=CAMNT_0049536035 /DNA_START=35 /DNA_END=457 /DNA_ORIENTATION=-
MASLQSSMMGSRMVAARKAPKVASRTSVKVNAKAASKPAAKNAMMVCIDCGYLYDGKRGPFAELPKSYVCPVCGSGKNRFKAYSGKIKSNDNKSMGKRREELVSGLPAEEVEADLSNILALGAGSLAFLGAVYYFATQLR